MSRIFKPIFPKLPVSIIMPVLNNLSYTEKAINSIEKNTMNEYELIIIDNASTDGTEEYLKQKSEENDKIKIISNEKNLGVSKSWNLGVSLSEYDIVCIVNNDIEIMTPDWAYEMQKIISKNSHIYWVSPRTCYEKDSKRMTYKRTHYEQLAYGNNPDSYVVGCCFMCPKIAFSEIGMFDEKFDIKYYEDLDYINRIMKAGKIVSMCNSVIVYHAVGATSRITPGGETNESYYKEKWGDTPYDILARNFNTRK